MILALYSVLFIYLAIGEPLLRQLEYGRFIKDLRNNKKFALSKYYKRDAFRNWMQVGYLLAIASYFHISIADFGLRSIKLINYYNMPFYLQIIALLLILAYVIDLYIIPCIFSRINEKVKLITIRVLAQMKHLSPRNVKEYFWWSMHVFNSITEELMYRGFVFYFIPKLLPDINILFIFLLSACLDGLRFYNRPVIARFVFFSAICLSTLYVIFDSIYIPILFGVARYLKLFVLPWSYVTKEDQKNALGFIPN